MLDNIFKQMDVPLNYQYDELVKEHILSVNNIKVMPEREKEEDTPLINVKMVDHIGVTLAKPIIFATFDVETVQKRLLTEEQRNIDINKL
ncbi:MAG TPA: hypothetical protein VJU85_06095, partial [Nitrososphaeraceae archaeon]|nr:hypothetical protein [Nitrososphaeraceae archaeon]